MHTRAHLTREKVGRVVEMLTSRRIRVTQIGMQAYVRWSKKGAPEVVNLPYIPDTAQPDFLDAIEGFLDHEVAHVLFTEFEWVEKSYKLGKKVAQLTNLIEDTWIERRMSKEFAGTASNLEAVRKFFLTNVSDAALAKAMDARDMNAAQACILVPAFRALAGQPEFKAWMDDGDKWKYVKAFFELMGRDLMDKMPHIKSTEGSFNLAVAIHNRIEEARKREQERREKAKSERDARKAAREKAKEKEKPPIEPKPSEEGDEGDEEDGDPSDDESDEGDAGIAESDEDDGEPGEPEDSDDGETEEGGDEPSDEDADGEAEDESEEEEAEGTGPDEDADEEEEELKVEDDEESGDPAKAESDGDAKADVDDPSMGDPDKSDEPSESEDEAAERAEEDAAVPEIPDTRDFDDELAKALSATAEASVDDKTYLAVTRDFDRIERYEPSLMPAHIDSYVKDLDERVGGMIGSVQKKLERSIAARSHARHVPGFRSGKLHSASLHRLMTGDERVFKRKQEILTKDVAVSLVIDMSGSMSGRRLPIAIAAGYALSSALDKLNIKHEVCGFTTVWQTNKEVELELRSGRSGEYARYEAIYQPIIKTYDERLSAERIRAFAAIEHEVRTSQNVDGESIEYAAMRLKRRHEKRKIIIVLSDGQPACLSTHRNAHELLCNHLRSVIQRIAGSGMEPYGIGIQSTAVAEFYPQYTVIERLEDLPLTVMSAVEQMLLGRPQVAE